MAGDVLHVGPDQESILFQAVDVLVTSLQPTLLRKLGATDIRGLRAEAFGKVFDSPDVSDILPALSLKGEQLEVSLRDSGTLKVIIS